MSFVGALRPKNSITAAAHRVTGFLDRLLRPDPLRIIAFCGLAGWAVAFVVFVLRMPGPVDARGQHLGGDFLNFYTAGRMVLAGDGARLYDLHAQVAAQRTIVGRPDWDSLAAYVNPPIVALACAPFAALPYRVGYVASAAALLLIFLLGLRALRPCVPHLAPYYGLVVALALLFYPFTRTITGGQNPAVSFALLAAIYAALRRPALSPQHVLQGSALQGRQGEASPYDTSRRFRQRDLAAGLWLGLLFYKPQMAVLLTLLLAFQLQFRVVLVAACVAGAQYAVGALVSGPAWPLDLAKSLNAYWPLEFRYNGAHQVSWLGFCEYALPTALFKPIGLALVALTLAALLWSWRRATPARPEFALQYGLAVCATVLISPHTQWYDAGLVLLPALLALDHLGGRDLALTLKARLALAGGFLLFPLYLAAPGLGWQPLVALPVGVFLWLMHLRYRVRAPAVAGGATLARPATPAV